MDIQKIKELALANGFKLKEQASGNLDLNAYVYDFANAIEREVKAQAVPEWISMEDKYPKAGESVLICINGIRQNIAYFYDCSVSDEYSTGHDWFEPVFTGGEAGDECVVKTEDVTHWMLLPQEPAND